MAELESLTQECRSALEARLAGERARHECRVCAGEWSRMSAILDAPRWSDNVPPGLVERLRGAASRPAEAAPPALPTWAWAMAVASIAAVALWQPKGPAELAFRPEIVAELDLLESLPEGEL